MLTVHLTNQTTHDLAITLDGWAHLAPLGDFPGTAIVEQPDGTIQRIPAVQRIDRESVIAMVNEFHSWLGAAKRFLRGRKLYVGHPDVPGYDAADPSPRGIFTALEARDDGLWGKLTLTDEGSDLIESGTYKSLSPHWLANQLDETHPPIFRPVQFRSAGLTNRPNLPVRQLTNETGAASAPATNPATIMDKTKLIAWLTRHGITAAPDATDDQLLAHLDQPLTALANERDQVKTTLQAREQAIADLTQRATTAETAFANERKLTIVTALDTAQAAGRIIPADRAVWQTRLETNFANELSALQALAPAIKTDSVTGDLGTRKATLANISERRSKIHQLVQAKMQTGLDYDAAFSAVSRENPALFEAMQKPQ